MSVASSTAVEQLSTKILVCSHCPKSFRYNSEKIRHEMSHSPGFECQICCKKFSFISALRRHCKQHESKERVKCEECNRKFRDEVLLQRHVKYAHKGTFTCPKCGSIFNSEQALHTHMKTHRPESQRRFKCSYNGCGKSFNFSHHLKHHELTHTNEKQHYCSVCGKGFIQFHHLKTHLKTHDPSRWLHCEFPRCKKKFSTEYAKKRHMATHKLKPDSRILSDSNSCDASLSSKDNSEDFILCASCGENVFESDISKHSLKCRDLLDLSANMESCAVSPIKKENLIDRPFLTDSRTLEGSIKVEHKVKTTVQFDKHMQDCETALGGCIMGANNCVCIQISRTKVDNYDFTPFGDTDNVFAENSNNIDKFAESNNNNIFNSYSESILNFCNKENGIVKRLNSNTKSCSKNMFEDCECADTCCINDTQNCNSAKNKITNTPNVQTVDGVVKIKDTFDLDISIASIGNEGNFEVESAVKNVRNVIKVDNEFVPFSTCRDAIGACLAEGNEGCLCARMMGDDQQAMAQEIDNITPIVKTACCA